MKKIILVLSFVIYYLSFSFAQSETLFALGADISGFTELEAQGHKWYNWKGEERECTALMKEMGMNAIRLRVWVEDENGLDAKGKPWSCKKDVLDKALRAKAQGMDIMIDFHYSDWWADPAKQNIPKAWEKMNYKKMRQAMVNHTVDVLSLLKQNGVTPKWVQVGNETSNGMLWSVEMDPETGWEKKDANGKTIITKRMGHIDTNPEQYAGFIGAGYDAVKSVFPEAIVIVHLDNGFDNNLYNRNLDIVKQYGGKFDMIGMSLYPFWAMQSGMEANAKITIMDCIKNIRKVAVKYNCDVMITETGFEVDETKPWKMQLGREQYSELMRRAATETDGHCKGVFYWAPESKPQGYTLVAFDSEGRPTDIMRAMMNETVRTNGKQAKDHKMLMRYDRKVVEISTTEGDIFVELYNETPKHRDNFLKLAEENTLDTCSFFRNIKDFMIQGGSPVLDEPNPQIPAEIIFPKAFHKRGALAMAREADEDNPELCSGQYEFYIVWGDWPGRKGRNPYVEMLPYYEEYGAAGTPWLDGGYTVFGEVVYGLDTVDKIQNLKNVKILKVKTIN